MIDHSTPALVVYNPDLLSEEDVKQQFVVRQRILNELLSDLSATDGPQHHLIVGQRGMGKTTLLRRLRYAVRDDPLLTARWLALPFPEEQYNIAHLSDLWVNCLDALGDALEASGDVTAAEEVDRIVCGLPNSGEELRATTALEALLGWIRAHRGLVLLVDNIDLVLRRLARDEWALREVMSEEQRLVVVGTSTQHVTSTTEYGAAFYDFFRVHELRGLTHNASLRLVLKLAELHASEYVASQVREQPGRFEALHQLTGGNPRTLVLLYQVLAQEQHADLQVAMERLLDLSTPLYKDRFEAFPPQAQVIVDALALGWDPMTANALARQTRLDVNIVSSQLNRLARQGAVERVPLPPSKRMGFQIAERFFNIWYLMRASRRVRRRFVWLMRFLEAFYGPDGLRARGERLLRADPPAESRAKARAAELAIAFAAKVDEPGLARALASRGIDLLLDDDGPRPLPSDPALDAMSARKVTLSEARAAVLAARADWRAAGTTVEEFAGLLVSSPSRNAAAKRALAEQLDGRDPPDIAAMVAELRTEASRLEATWGVPAAAAIQEALAGGVLDPLDDEVGLEAASRLSGTEISGAPTDADVDAHHLLRLREQLLERPQDCWRTLEETGLYSTIARAVAAALSEYRHRSPFVTDSGRPDHRTLADEALAEVLVGMIDGGRLVRMIDRYLAGELGRRSSLHKLLEVTTRHRVHDWLFPRWGDAARLVLDEEAPPEPSTPPTLTVREKFETVLGATLLEAATQEVREGTVDRSDLAAWMLERLVATGVVERSQAVEIGATSERKLRRRADVIQRAAVDRLLRGVSSDSATAARARGLPHGGASEEAVAGLTRLRAAGALSSEQALAVLRWLSQSRLEAVTERRVAGLAELPSAPRAIGSLRRRAVERIVEFVERWGGIGAPVALVQLSGSTESWLRARPVLQRAFADGDWDLSLLALRRALATGHGEAAVDLFDASPAAERWRPLRAAMVAAVHRDVDQLRRVSPETRHAARLLFDALRPASPRPRLASSRRARPRRSQS